MKSRAHKHLVRAPSLEREFCRVHRAGFFRGFLAGILVMIIAGVIVRVIVMKGAI